MQAISKLSGALLLLAAAPFAAQAMLAEAPVHHHTIVTNAIDDPAPDPSDCPFCGGNPQVHVRAMVGLERVSMAMYCVLMP